MTVDSIRRLTRTACLSWSTDTEIWQALLPVLDGRTDIALEEKTEERSTRFYLSCENGILMKMKRKVLEVLNVMFGMRASTRIDELLYSMPTPTATASPTYLRSTGACSMSNNETSVR